MNTKYKLDENDTIVVDGTTLFRIICLTAFADVAAGEKGGYIRHESNLQVYGDAWVYGNARVYGNAQVYGNAWVYDNARVYGNAQVYGDAQVYGNARVYGDARVCGDAWVKFSKCDFDCADPRNINNILKIAFDCSPVGGFIRLYKRINKNFTSCYDKAFKYPERGAVECGGPLDYSLSCGSGMHFSSASYWEDHGDILIAADIPVDSILAVANGKVRCSNAFIVGVCDE